MGAIVIRTRYDEGTESAEVATSEANLGVVILITYDFKMSYLSWHLLSYYRLESHTLD